jgi:hypothetical protein
MQSIDRKLARVAREIEEAKPKVMSFAEFEQKNHALVDTSFMTPWAYASSAWVTEEDCRQIKGAAQESPMSASVSQEQALTAAPVAAPPSPKFKVGDRVRLVEEPDETGTVIEVMGGGAVRVNLNSAGVGLFRKAQLHWLELLPQQQEGDGWFEHDGSNRNPVPLGKLFMCVQEHIEGERGPFVSESPVWYGRVLRYRVLA